MNYTVDTLADVAGMTAEAFLRKIKGELGDQLPEIHQWTAKTQVNGGHADLIVNWLGLDEERSKIKAIDAFAITKADEAVKEAKFRLVESLKIQSDLIVEELTTQAKAIGVSGGVNAGLELLDGFMQGQEAITNAFIDESWKAFDGQKEAIDQTAIKIATRTGTNLGNVVNRCQKAKKRISDLNSQINKLLS